MLHLSFCKTKWYHFVDQDALPDLLGIIVVLMNKALPVAVAYLFLSHVQMRAQYQTDARSFFRSFF